MVTKICYKCKKIKLLSSFTRNSRSADGKAYTCRECTGIKDINARHEFAGKIIDGLKVCSKCLRQKSVDRFDKNVTAICGLRSWCKSCCYLDNLIMTRILKMKVVIGYGGKCKCCGETRLSLLTIEHIRYKGHEFVYNSNTTNLMFKLKALNYPEGYTILCYNCNLSTKQGRPCIHTEEYKIYEKAFEKFLSSNKKRITYKSLVDKLQIMNLKNVDLVGVP